MNHSFDGILGEVTQILRDSLEFKTKRCPKGTKKNHHLLNVGSSTDQLALAFPPRTDSHIAILFFFFVTNPVKDRIFVGDHIQKMSRSESCRFFFVHWLAVISFVTLPETNIAPENRPLEKEIPIGIHHFYGRTC